MLRWAKYSKKNENVMKAYFSAQHVPPPGLVQAGASREVGERAGGLKGVTEAGAGQGAVRGGACFYLSSFVVPFFWHIISLVFSSLPCFSFSLPVAFPLSHPHPIFRFQCLNTR
jgi:hypothetical protein